MSSRELLERAKCDRCRVRYVKQPTVKQTLWNTVYKKGMVVGFLCPDCQTDAESAEATINEATLHYVSDAAGYRWARPKHSSSD
jgi:hypothetical protein